MVFKGKGMWSSLAHLLLLGFLWGSGYTLARYAVTHDVTPLGYAFWQALGPAVLLSFFAWLRRQSFVFSWASIGFYAVCGLIGIAVPNVNMYFSAQHVPSGMLSVIVNTVPVFTLVIAWASGAEQVRALRLLGMALCVSGLMWLTYLHYQGGSVAWPWMLSALLTPLCFSLCALFIAAKQPQGLKPLLSASGMMWAATLWLAPVVGAHHAFYPLWNHFDMRASWVILLEILLSSLGYVVLFRLIARAGAVYYSLVGVVVACTGLLWGAAVFHELFTAPVYGAVALMLLGLLVCTVSRPDQSKVPKPAH
jgi:drug/metabolite transporter (DMT)-like permease